MRKSLLALSVLALSSTSAFAADYSDGDTHKNDYKWLQFNAMYSFGEIPTSEGATKEDHDYLEMEFGGRSGIWDLYGYVDVFNLSQDSGQKKANGVDSNEKMFMKFAPRMSLDGLTGKDLSFGPVQELYIATLMNWSGNDVVNNANIGLGSDVMVPWLGKVGLNLMAHYEIGRSEWDGFHASTNWFKPFFFFENGSFISYQGYIDWQFGMDSAEGKSADGGNMFNGIYWHSDRFAVGYGLKAYKNVYGLKDESAWPGADTTGFSHYVSATYKF
ncbi:outer membrane protein OmpK [Psychromonas ossibalaenae]|uniref:nucleoside-specific channel-forming Tsx family protein n=1 Tax=Psychromonas ossibalaenae TaxID=444922 RepID=UPI0003762C10|nr:outer membrane protein OmpK [Psychromonas ossibalaenae]